MGNSGGNENRDDVSAQISANLTWRSCLLAHVPFHRVLHQLARASQAKFFFDVRLVGFDGLDAEMQDLGDLPSSMAIADKAEDFQFAVGQLRDRGVFRGIGAVNIVLQHAVGDLFTDVNLTAEYPSQGHQHFLGGLLLHDVAVRAGAKGS